MPTKDIQSGVGRNYFSVSFFESVEGISNPFYSGEIDYVYTLEPDTYYTLSTTAPFRDSRGRTYIHFDNFPLRASSSLNGVAHGSPKTILTNNEGKVSITINRFYTQETISRIINGDYKIHLEKGTTATDWKPAPEDITDEGHIFDLQGKKLYVGDQTIKRVYLGDDLLYHLPGPPVTPTLTNNLFNVGVAYDFTHGNIDQYYLSTGGSFTGTFNHNSITSYATYAEQVSTIAFNSGSNTQSSWGSITFSADSDSGRFYRKDGRYEGYTDLYYENNGPSNRRIRWGIKRGRNSVRYSYYSIPSDFEYITVDIGTNGSSNKLYVNGVERLTNRQDSIADDVASPFSFYRLSGNKIYDIKAMYGNSNSTRLSASNVAESYANIEERLNR